MAIQSQHPAEPMTIDTFIDWMKIWRDGEKWELINGYAIPCDGRPITHFLKGPYSMSALAESTSERMNGEEFDRWMKTWSNADKWELHDGYVIAMAGGTKEHDRIASNISYAVRQLRSRGCGEYRDNILKSPVNSDFRVFPDVYVRCGPITSQTSSDDPVAVFEVLSKSTWNIDRGYKQFEYFKFPTLKHLVLVYQSEFRAEMWSRGEDGEWIEEPTILKSLGETLHLSAFDLDIPMAEIYADTELAAAG